jgi:hypothetical protein
VPQKHPESKGEASSARACLTLTPGSSNFLLAGDNLLTENIRRVGTLSLDQRSQISHIASRPPFACQRLLEWLFLAVLTCGASTSSHAQGYPQGQPAVGSSTAVLVPSSMLLDASQFSGADPCAKIAAAESQQGNAVIDGRGLGNSGNITTPCALTDANGANFLANATGGFVNLPPATIWVPFAPPLMEPPYPLRVE